MIALLLKLGGAAAHVPMGNFRERMNFELADMDGHTVEFWPLQYSIDRPIDYSI